MNICNKPHNKIAPEDLGEAVPEVKVQRARRNGWSWPLHLFQVIAWLLFLFFALVGFGILVPLLPRHWLPAGYICPGVCFLYHLVVHLTAVSIDPADANVREKNYLGPLATFNRNQHAHVIENHHCHVCDVDVLFLNSVLSAILGLGLLLLVAFYVFVEFFVDPAVLRSDQHFDALRNHMDRWFVFLPASPVETRAPAILVTAGIFILLSLVTVILLGHLLTFHIYLLWHRLTTYEYILQQRPQQQPDKVDKKQESCSSQVRPSQEADLLSGNPGYTDPGIQVEEFSTVTSGRSFPKLYVHNQEGDPKQSSSPESPSLHSVAPSQQQKKRRKKVQKVSSSAMDSGSKAHATPQLSFPDPPSELPAMAAASPSHRLHLLVPAFPLRAAVSPSSMGLIQAAGPPAHYHSESVESMDEIPVAQICLVSPVLQGPPKNNSSNSQRYPLSTDNPRGVRKKNLYSEHKVKRRSCQQDRHVERDLELFSKIPAVFVSKSSGEPLVPQPQPSESTSEPDHRKCTSKQHVGTPDPCSKDIRTSTTAA
ncbi:probable palmitoyltransferase ZDHHC1 isoform X3 [Camarhynchus parvulus]|uniref:probable palmitoyltransferase ZDHHC1 isoform X3 n=1 Tax=Geospiza parvula TaxID=87175 RepID=UPI00123810E2|nr:probable palmitoyltransferase ZDHHC1 isoform X3 [Camarhynchus parvulus]